MSIHAWLRWDAIQRLLPDDAGTILEIGTGLGSAGALLSRRLSYVGLEPDPRSFEVAVQRIGNGGVVLNQSVEAYESQQPFDIVCAFEVLEHIHDDRVALAGWRRHVRPGGWILLSVPAGSHRFAAADAKAGHVRRYDRSELVGTLESTGFVRIEVVAYGFPLGYALEAVRNVYARRHPSEASMEERTAASGRWLQPSESTAQLTRLGSAPFRYLQRPFAGTNLGTGFVARARRPE